MKPAMRYGHRGLTLIEVIVGIAMLSTLLVGVLLSFGRLSQQTAKTVQIGDAITAADSLLESWFDDGEIPSESIGRFSNVPPLWWKTSIVDNKLYELGVCVIRLSISDARAAGVPLISVDVLAPKDRTNKQT